MHTQVNVKNLMNTLRNADILCVALLRLNARSTAWINYIPSAHGMCYLLCHIFMICCNPNGIHHANFVHLHSHSFELWFCFEKFNSFSTNRFLHKMIKWHLYQLDVSQSKENHAISWNAKHIQRISHFFMFAIDDSGQICQNSWGKKTRQNRHFAMNAIIIGMLFNRKVASFAIESSDLFKFWLLNYKNWNMSRERQHRKLSSKMLGQFWLVFPTNERIYLRWNAFAEKIQLSWSRNVISFLERKHPKDLCACKRLSCATNLIWKCEKLMK